MTARLEDFDVLCILVPDGITEVETSAILGGLNSDEPDFWTLFQPDTVLMFFLSKKSGALRAARAKEMVAALKGIRSVKFGVSKGALVAEIPLFGKISQMPLGGAVTEAQHVARGSA